MKFFSLILIVFLLGCKMYPDNETVILGKVVDESGKPINNLKMYIVGKNQKNILSISSTFRENFFTDSNGEYHYERIIYKGTDFVDVGLADSEILIDSAFVNNNKFPQISTSFFSDSFGEKITINFKVFLKK